MSLIVLIVLPYVSFRRQSAMQFWAKSIFFYRGQKANSKFYIYIPQDFDSTWGAPSYFEKGCILMHRS